MFGWQGRSRERRLDSLHFARCSSAARLLKGAQKSKLEHGNNSHRNDAAVCVSVFYLHISQVQNSSQNLEQTHLIGLVDTCSENTRPHVSARASMTCQYGSPQPTNPPTNRPLSAHKQTSLNEFNGQRTLPSSEKALRVLLSSFVSSTPSMTGLRPFLVYEKSSALPERKTNRRKDSEKSFDLCNLSSHDGE